jgi:type IV secretory pathway TrbD component
MMHWVWGVVLFALAVGVLGVALCRIAARYDDYMPEVNGHDSKAHLPDNGE